CLAPTGADASSTSGRAAVTRAADAVLLLACAVAVLLLACAVAVLLLACAVAKTFAALHQSTLPQAAVCSGHRSAGACSPDGPTPAPSPVHSVRTVHQFRRVCESPGLQGNPGH